MSKALLISAKQCKRARALLKWNPLDLASRTRIPVSHLEKFERSQVRLTKPENDEVVKVFERNKIEFLRDGDVGLHSGGSHSGDGEYHQSTREFKHYTLEDPSTKTTEEVEAQTLELQRKAKEDEEKRLKREAEETEKRRKQGS